MNNITPQSPKDEVISGAIEIIDNQSQEIKQLRQETYVLFGIVALLVVSHLI